MEDVRLNIVVTLPIKIESSLNLREHWRTRANRNSSHRAAAFISLRGMTKWRPEVLPCTVTLTRIAPRELDDDNLAGGFKSVRDGVADWLGVDDRDRRIAWVYRQERGAPKHYAARVEIKGAST
jgi:hypothetical protein